MLMYCVALLILPDNSNFRPFRPYIFPAHSAVNLKLEQEHPCLEPDD